MVIPHISSYSAAILKALSRLRRFLSPSTGINPSHYTFDHPIAPRQVKRKHLRRHDASAALEFFSQESASAVQPGFDFLYADIQSRRGLVYVKTFHNTQ